MPTLLLQLRLAAATAACALLAGCAPSSDAGVGRYVVTAEKSPFYKYGPAQTFGADFTMTRGQKVTVTKRSFGYSMVTTDDGVAGYLPSDDLAPAAPAPSSAAARPASRNKGASRRVRSAPPEHLEGASPLFDVAPDLPLPSDSEKPKPAGGKPAFLNTPPKVN